MHIFGRREQVKESDDAAFQRLYHTIPNRQTGQEGPTGDLSLPASESSPAAAGPEKPSLRQKWKKLIKRMVIALAILLALTGLWLSGKFVLNAVRIFGWQGLAGIFQNQKLKGEEEGRVTVLLAGNSADDPGHGGAELTDSIMLASFNTESKTAYLLSIPRDFYVNIPDYGYAKINEAYQIGKKQNFHEPGFAEGGMGLLQKTLAQHLGVNMHYYGLVNYAGLQEAVDAVGGVTITVTSSDPRGLYDPSPDLRYNRQPLVKLPNGQVTLDGRAALNLARARGNARGSYGYAQGDFIRTEYQRKILVGLKDRALSAGTLVNPLKAGQLLDSAGDNVQTDFKTGEIRRLYELGKEVPNGNIKSVSLNNANGKNLLKSYRTHSGQSALIPAAGLDDYAEIQGFMGSL